MIELYNKIKSKYLRTLKAKSLKNTPYQENMTYQLENHNWYDPLVAGSDTFKNDLSSVKTIRGVIEVLKMLQADKYIEFNLGYLNKGIEEFGEDWRCGDITTALYSIGRKINVENYLEIGVRRGRSMAMVAKLNPNVDIIGFDMWIQNYVGIENPGPEYVKEELKKVGHTGPVDFINGNSRHTVPLYLSQNPDKYFDLITVDGDHTKRGAKIDLKNVIPRLKIGGFLVFDDIVNPWHTQLDRLWKSLVVNSKRFTSYEYRETGYGVGVAIKKW